MSSLEIQKPSMLSLPDDLLFRCLARVSRLYYPTLSLVSKSFRSLLASPELYKVRSSLGNTESCLYVHLRFFPHDYQWFTLCRKPDQFITNDSKYVHSKKKSRGYVLAKLPISRYALTTSLSLVAFGSDIFNIAGASSFWPCSRVTVLDCTSHTWREAPSLRAELSRTCANVVNQKIYVGGSYYDEDLSSWKKLVEVFDTKTQIWDHVPSPSDELYHTFTGSACIDGKLHLKGTRNEVVAYNSEEGRWDSVGTKMGLYMSNKSYCVIENVLYSSTDEGVLQWYDTSLRMWKELKGLGGLPEFPRDAHSVNLVDYGGNMAVFWNKELHDKTTTMIWFVEISLEKRNSDDIWGKFEFFDHVLTVPRKCDDVVRALAATV